MIRGASSSSLSLSLPALAAAAAARLLVTGDCAVSRVAPVVPLLLLVPLAAVLRLGARLMLCSMLDSSSSSAPAPPSSSKEGSGMSAASSTPCAVLLEVACPACSRRSRSAASCWMSRLVFCLPCDACRPGRSIL
jgi:hypothetical protein